MKLLTVSGLNHSFDAPLFSGVSFDVLKNDRIGLVGPNGAGKTTLFKLLLKEILPSSGDIFVGKQVNLGYMAQHLDIYDDNTVYTETLRIFAHLDDIAVELEQLHQDIDNQSGDLDMLVKRQYALTERFEQFGGLTFQSRTRSMLKGLGFSDDDLEKPIRALSGGEKTKISLAKMLLSDADLLLLDEPTNHLDIVSVEWLESFLLNCDKAFIVISHDRRFLDTVTNRTFDLENGRLNVYKGNYTEHLKQRMLDKAQIERDNKNVQREIDRINGIIEQQKRWNQERNYKTIRSKQHEIDRLKVKLKATERENRTMFVQFDMDTLGGKDVASVSDVSKAFGAQTLFNHVDIAITRGERVFLLGANGSGKTTLFKILQGEVTPDIGEVKLGINVFPAYYDQTQRNLDESKTVYDSVHDNHPDMTETQVRKLLGAFLFVQDDVFKSVSTLSGGERSRLALLLLMLSKSNFLLLDEPTNHLDIKSKEALQHALNEYPGTLLVISHDRYLINEMADRILYLENETITNYIGNYDYYQLKRASDYDEPKTVVQEKTENDYQQRKAVKSEINKLSGKISRLEEAIRLDESKVSEMEHQMASPEIANDYSKALILSDNVEKLKEKVTEKYDKLHDLEQALEGLKK